MGRKPKAGGAKAQTTDPEQFARFVEAARKAGVDESGEAFERAFDKVARAPRPARDGGRPEDGGDKPGGRRGDG